MRARLALLCCTLLATTSQAGTKVIKNDTFTGLGNIFAGLSFGEFQGAGVLFEPDPSEYPLTVIGVDILVVPFMQVGSGVGAYELDVWDESAGTVPPPRPNDGGSYYYGRVDRQGVQVSTSSTMFNRYLLTTPLIVPSGKVFVKFSEQTDTSTDGTTIALDTSPTQKPNANWFFDGFGNFVRMDLPDGGSHNNIKGNWIVRLVLQVPDQAVTVTSITPSSSLTNVATPVVITGTHFELGAKAFIGTTELTLSNVSAGTIGATVPVGIVPGTYDVKVRNTSGLEGVLTGGYTVLQSDGGMGGTGGGTGGGGTGGGAAGGGTGGSNGNEALALTDVTPKQTYAEDATALFLTGAGFKAGAQVLIGGTRVDGPVVESGGVISASLVANTLTPGTYDVSVILLTGEKATLPMAFTVLAGSHVAPKGCVCTSVDLAPFLGAFVLALARRRRRA